MTQAQRMLTSYSRIRGTSITIIETASGGLRSAAATAESTIA